MCSAATAQRRIKRKGVCVNELEMVSNQPKSKMAACGCHRLTCPGCVETSLGFEEAPHYRLRQGWSRDYWLHNLSGFTVGVAWR